ncbi:hypothetical protein P7C70_g4528, partial [Phenoliferia sp. Uapishka_3]
MGNLALIILNAVTFVLNIGPVYSQVAQGNANSSVISGLYFACFGLGAESLVQYRKAASMLGFGCWGNRSRGLKAEKSEDGVRMTRRWGSTTEAEHTDARSPTNSPNYGGPFHVKYEEAGRPAGVSRGVKVVVEREEDIV